MTKEDLKEEVFEALSEITPTPAPTSPPAPPPTTPDLKEADIILRTIEAIKTKELEEIAARRASDPIAVAEDEIESAAIPTEYKELVKKRISERLTRMPNPSIEVAKWLAEEDVKELTANLERQKEIARENEARRELDMFKRYGQEFHKVKRGLIASLEDTGLTQESAEVFLNSLSHEQFQAQVDKYYRTNHLGGRNPYAQPEAITNSKPVISPDTAKKIKTELGW